MIEGLKKEIDEIYEGLERCTNASGFVKPEHRFRFALMQKTVMAFKEVLSYYEAKACAGV